MSLASVYLRLSNEQPEAAAVSDRRGGGLTYRALWERSEALYRSGLVNRGEVVAVHLDRTCEWMVTYVALLRCGAVVLPLDSDNEKREFRESRNTKAISNVPVYYEPRARVKLAVVLDKASAEEFKKIYEPDFDVVSLDSLPPAGAVHTSPDYCTDPAPVFCLMQTGGSTTGQPKLVPILHAMATSEVDNYAHVVPSLSDASGHVVMSHSPMVWTASAVGQVNIALALGGCVAFKESGADLQTSLNDIRPTVIGGVPSQFLQVQKIPESVR